MTSKTVKNAAGDLAQRIASCHAFGHQWRLGSAIGIDDTHPNIKRPFAMSTGMLGIPSECISCTSSKVRWVTRSGENINRYDYVEGYQRRTANGDEVLTPQEWRHNYVETLFAEFEATATGRKRKAAS